MHTGWWENVKDKRPLGGPRHRWEHNIKWTLKLDLEDVNQIHLPEDKDKWLALVITVMAFWFCKM